MLTRGRPSEGTAFTIETAAKWKKPYLVIDLGPVPSPHEDLRVAALSWISQHDIRVLNIAGPRESKCPGIHEETRTFLKTILEGLR